MKKLVSGVAALLLSLAPLMYSQAVSAAEAQTVTGIVTQVRPASRVLRVRDNATRERHNYSIPVDARITIDGVPRPLARIERGQEVTLRYRVTDAGRVVESVRVPDPEVIAEVPPEPAPVAAATPAVLPKTAGPLGLLLVLGGLFGGCALVLRRLRRA